MVWETQDPGTPPTDELRLIEKLKSSTPSTLLSSPKPFQARLVGTMVLGAKKPPSAMEFRGVRSLKRKGLTGLQDAELGLVIGLRELDIVHSRLSGKNAGRVALTRHRPTATRPETLALSE